MYKKLKERRAVKHPHIKMQNFNILLANNSKYWDTDDIIYPFNYYYDFLLPFLDYENDEKELKERSFSQGKNFKKIRQEMQEININVKMNLKEFRKCEAQITRTRVNHEENFITNIKVFNDPNNLYNKNELILKNNEDLKYKCDVHQIKRDIESFLKEEYENPNIILKMNQINKIGISSKFRKTYHKNAFFIDSQTIMSIEHLLDVHKRMLRTQQKIKYIEINEYNLKLIDNSKKVNYNPRAYRFLPIVSRTVPTSIAIKISNLI